VVISTNGIKGVVCRSASWAVLPPVVPAFIPFLIWSLSNWEITMNRRFKKACWLAAMTLSSLSWLPQSAHAADTGSAAFDRYAQDLRLRLQAAANGSYWISTQVDEGAFERYLAAMGESAAGPGLTDTATQLASMGARPLRSFNSYLVYLGRRMSVDAGPPGALLDNGKGTETFDRYIEDINFRIQALYQADEELR
jgi:hypothetical protein